MGNENTISKGNTKEDPAKLKKLEKIPEDKLEEDKVKIKERRNVTSPVNNNAFVVPTKETSLSQDSIDTWTSSDQEKHMRVLHPLPATGFAHRNQQKKTRYKSNDTSPPTKSVPGCISIYYF